MTSTDPGPGTNLPVGSTVTVFYSAGLVTMPSVVGLTEDEATNTLEALNLIVAYSRDPTSSESAGTVIAQDPAEGTKLASGERVVVTVSSKPDVTPTTPTTPTPPSTETPTTPTPPSTETPGSPSTSTHRRASPRRARPDRRRRRFGRHRSANGRPVNRAAVHRWGRGPR